VIGRGVGAITQADVNLALASDAVIIGFNVRPAGRAGELAQREGVDIRYYSIIYQAIEEVEAALKGMLKPEFEEAQLGTAEVRELYRPAGRLGIIRQLRAVIRTRPRRWERNGAWRTTAVYTAILALFASRASSCIISFGWVMTISGGWSGITFKV